MRKKRKKTSKSKNISHQRSFKSISDANEPTTYPQVFYPPPLQSFLKQQQLTYPRYTKPEPPRTIWDISVSSNLLSPIGGIGLFILGFVAVVKGLSLSQVSLSASAAATPSGSYRGLVSSGDFSSFYGGGERSVVNRNKIINIPNELSNGNGLIKYALAT